MRNISTFNNITILVLDKTILPLMNILKLFEAYTFKHVICPKGWGCEGKDINFLTNEAPCGITIESNILNALSDSDYLLCTDYSDKKLYDKTYKLATEMANKNNVKCLSWSDIGFYDDYLKETNGYEFNEFQKLNTPIITFSGLAENIGQAKAQISVKYFLEQKGYKVGLISDNSLVKLFGAYQFPSGHFSNSSAHKALLHLNNLVFKIQEHYDIILLNIPKQIIPFDTDVVLDDYGSVAFLSYQAVISDYNICFAHFEQWDKSFVDNLKNLFVYRFSTTLNCICMTNFQMDDLVSSNNNIIATKSISHHLMETWLKESELPNCCFVLPSTQINTYQNICDDILNLLEE